MNVCAGRSEVKLNPWNAPYLEKLPHEPKSEERFALAVSNGLNNLRSDNDYAECKHCGCIYPEES